MIPPPKRGPVNADRKGRLGQSEQLHELTQLAAVTGHEPYATRLRGGPASVNRQALIVGRGGWESGRKERARAVRIWRGGGGSTPRIQKQL